MSPLFSCSALLPIIALFAATTVRGHGYVGNILADGTKYDGPAPVDQAGALSTQTPIRQIASEQPITDVKSNLIACGSSTSAPASEVAKVSSGSVLKAQWYNGGGTPKWPHDTGPMLTYMAPCSSSDCKDDPNKLSFFKIQQDGQVSGDPTKWVQAEIMNGTPYSITIPSGVPNGAYIMRHEIISLQNAASGGAESYTSCFQLQVTGGKSTLSPSQFVSSLSSNSTILFPGGYNKNDPGWKVDVYTDPQNLDYSKMFPGPPISDAVKTGDGGGNGGVVNRTTTSGMPPTKTPSRNLPNTTTTASPTTSPASPVRVITTTITQTFVLTMTLDNANGPRNTTTPQPHPATTSLSSTTTGTVPTRPPRRSVPVASLRPRPPVAAEKRRVHRPGLPFRRH